MKEIYRSCNLCEAICGLRFEMEGDKILSIRADKEDPFSTGHICPKGPELKTIYEDKDRLRFPVKRIGSKWERISYEDAYIEVAESIHKIQTKYGDDSIGAYLGNPSVHNYGTILFGSKFFNKLKTRNLFSASSVDQLPHHFAAHFMFGHHFILPIPDIDRTDYFLMMGANPLASKGSMMTAPNINKRLKNLKERGAKLVVIDPRRTETAEIADRHLFIQPETDAFLLLSFLYILFTRNTLRLKRFENHISGIGELKDFVLAYPPGRTSAITGISEEALQQIVTEFTSSKRALVYGRIGLSVQRFGGLCQFLINSINLLSGNFDEPGGAMFTLPAVDILSLSNDSECGFNRWRSKARNLPEFNGEFPVSALADEILHPEGIKGFITSAGNPVLSTPNGNKLEKALSGLEFMLSVDFYINETSRFANIIIPPSHTLEREHYDLIFNAFAVRNVAKYSPAVFLKEESLRHDWEIFSDLAKALDMIRKGKTPQFSPSRINPESMLDYLLKSGPYGKSKKETGFLDLDELKKHPHGIDLGDLKPNLLDRIKTKDKKIVLFPEILKTEKQRLEDIFSEKQGQSDNTFLLIGRRMLKSNNSWMHNSERLLSGKTPCTALLHPDDAKRLQLSEKNRIKVKSKIGEIELPYELSDSIMPGVICIPHGYGHNREGVVLQVARQQAGVSINDLTDDSRMDTLSGNAALNGISVEVGGLDSEGTI